MFQQTTVKIMVNIQKYLNLTLNDAIYQTASGTAESLVSKRNKHLWDPDGFIEVFERWGLKTVCQQLALRCQAASCSVTSSKLSFGSLSKSSSVMAPAASQALGEIWMKFGSSVSSASSDGISDELGKWMDSALSGSCCLSGSVCLAYSHIGINKSLI